MADNGADEGDGGGGADMGADAAGDSGDEPDSGVEDTPAEDTPVADGPSQDVPEADAPGDAGDDAGSDSAVEDAGIDTGDDAAEDGTLDADATADADATPDAAPDSDVAEPELAVSTFHVQRNSGEDALVYYVTGVDREAQDVIVMRATVRDAAGDPLATGVGVSVEGATTYAGTSFVIQGVEPFPGAASAVAEVTIHLEDDAGHVSQEITAAVLAPSAGGDACIHSAEAETCLGSACGGEVVDGFGSCLRPPVLEGAEYLGFEFDSPSCVPEAPHLATVELTGTNESPLVEVIITGTAYAFDPVPGPTFELTVPLCAGWLAVDEPLDFSVGDELGLRSNALGVAFAGAVENEPCRPQLLGYCLPELRCDTSAHTCQPFAELAGVNCEYPMFLDADQTRIGESMAGHSNNFLSVMCGSGDPSTGFDSVYAIEVLPGEQVTATAQGQDADPIGIWLTTECLHAAPTCADGAADPGVVEATFTNEGAETVTAYLVVDSYGDDENGVFNLSVTRSTADDSCLTDHECVGGDGKLNVVLVVDFSTSMNTQVGEGETRWTRLAAGVSDLLHPGGEDLDDYAHVAMLRFGHDPASATAGTAIPNDDTGLIDGHRVDVTWTNDELGPASYAECQAAAVEDALALHGPPMEGSVVGIGTWTQGAMLAAQTLIAESIAEHTGEGARDYVVIVITDGTWTSPDGTQQLAPASANPALTAAELLEDGVLTYVLELSGDAESQTAANALAAAGGTAAAFTSFEALGEALIPTCD